MRLLVVEDDALVRDGVRQLLVRAGYAVDVVNTAEEAARALDHEPFDLMVLDIGLPGQDGFAFLERLRKDGQSLPVLVLTARDALTDRVHGLNLGADDYLAKPFAPEELLARVAALTRRLHGGGGGSTLQHGPLSLDLPAHRAQLAGQSLDLPGREWAILEFLLRQVDRVVSKSRIVSAVCSWDQDMSPTAIEVYISRLRAKLEPAGIRIRTIRGYGYLLEPWHEPE